MKIIGTYGPKRRRRALIAALVVAAMFIVMLLTQLYGYEDFAVTLGGIMPFNDIASLKVTAAAVVVAELLSLPYLLGMYLSKLMRIMCGTFAAATSVFWLFSSFTNSHANNSGLFSTVFELPGGILATAWTLLLFAGTVIVIKADIDAASSPLEKKAKLS